ncbi:MAG: hypothetical protein PVS3B1_02800 [Ktedonobacteraceae bacterium]
MHITHAMHTLHIRPFFWFLLLISCVGVITFAMLYQPHVPTSLQVHVVQQQLMASTPASLELSLTDPQGLPIEQAQVTPSARMTNMEMAATESKMIELGHGKYKVNISLYMAGPWAITIHTYATGFDPQQSTLLVQVV